MAPNYRQLARQYAQQYGVDPEIFVRQIQQESGFRPNVGSPAGAQGIAQIMPATARGWGVDPHDPVASLNAAARAMGKYLRSYKGDYRKALAAYNAGVGAVAKYGGVPPYAETQHYVKTILNGQTPGPTQSPSRAPAQAQNPSQAPQMDRKTAALEFIMRGSPFEGMATTRAAQYPTTTNATVAKDATVATGAGVPKRRRGETGQQYLDRVLQARFGLKHDPGNAQTTGGQHMSGSDHYVNKATDYGDGRNTVAQLQAAEDWLEANADALGLKVALYGADEDKNHADHLHAATLRSSKTLNKRGAY